MITPFVETADVQRLAGFYRQALGAVEIERVPPSGDVFALVMRIGDADLTIVRTADATGGYGEAPDPEQLAPVGRIGLDIPVPDPDAALRAIAAAGGEAADQANDMPWGRRVGHGTDIDGNALNLSAPVTTAAPGTR